MMAKLFLITVLNCLLVFNAISQTVSNKSVDSLIYLNPKVETNYFYYLKNGVEKNEINFQQQVLSHHPYFGFYNNYSLLHNVSNQKKRASKDVIFYALCLVTIFLAIQRFLFPKFFENLFQLFFRTTLKQRQLKDQLTERSFPSLLLNFFFTISFGLFLTLAAEKFNIKSSLSFWMQWLIAILAFGSIYVFKFLTLQILGWMFESKALTDNYFFIVTHLNKILGIFLIPIMWFFAFSPQKSFLVIWVIALILIFCILLYRLVSSISLFQGNHKSNPFQLLLYVAAFEIAPVLVMYKIFLMM